MRSTHLRGQRRLSILFGFFCGVVACFLLDPNQGRRRRRLLADRGLAQARRGWRRVNRFQRYIASQLYGLRQKAIHEPPWTEVAEAFRGGARDLETAVHHRSADLT